MRGRAAGAVLMFLLAVGAKALSSEPSTSACPGEADERGTLMLCHYPKLELRLPGLTNTKYGTFLAQLRKSLGSNAEIWSLQVLRAKDSVPMSDRFVLVDITNYAGETATLALDVTNLYVLGYRVGDDSFFIMPDPEDNNTREAITHLFPGTERHMFSFTGGYEALQKIADANRDSISLGTGALDGAVRSMNLYAAHPPRTALSSVANGLIVCIQMISEAARFHYIEFEMKSRIRRGVDSVPDPSIMRLETSWSALSVAIQSSNRDGVFDRAIDLQRRNYSMFQVFNVKTVESYISLLLLSCKPPSPKELMYSVPPSAALVIRLFTSESGVPPCPAHVQPTVRILGPDGLCVDVKEERYDNGNPIQLWPCKSSADQNQLWTFSSDGTLRSGGKCLASDGNRPGDNIVIHDCRPGVDAFTWHAWPNGTISSASGLVLSTHSSSSGTTLSARDNAFTTGQSWLPTNRTDPSVHQIAGLSGLFCLHADGDDDVVLRECDKMEEAGSWWALYPDSSIRPDQRRNDCIAPPDTQPNLPLKIVSCNPNSSLQRWLFRNDGTIVNLSNELVMDVRGSAVSGAHLTLTAWAGTEPQEWQPLL